MGKSPVEMGTAETAEWLRNRDCFLVLTHRRPDGDTLGCAGALVEGLRELGKTAYVLFNQEATPRYIDLVEEYWAPETYEPKEVITVDTARTELLTDNAAKYAKKISLCIDHHPTNDMYAEHTYLDATAASCGELIYEVIMALCGKVNKKAAGFLYAAISTDTGCFAFANTTANAFRISALLIEFGAPHRELNKRYFRTKSRKRVMVEGMVYSSLEFYYDGVLAISTITREMMETSGADEDDLDDIASLPGAVEGVRAAVTIRELTSKDDCKISVRTSSKEIDASKICAYFGGGGHVMAAGASVRLTAPEIKAMVIAVFAELTHRQ